MVQSKSSNIKETSMKVVLSLAFSLCLICFGVQVRDQVLKYFRKLTTITQTIQTPVEEALHLPSISICVVPGFKTDFMKANNISSSSWSFLADLSFGDQKPIEPVDDLSNFDAITYSKEELFLEDVSFLEDDNSVRFGDATIKPLYTIFNGKCFLIEINEKRQPFRAVIIHLRNVWKSDTHHNKFMVYTHSKGEEVHLQTQFWFTKDPDPLIVVPGSAVDLTVSKSMHNQLPSARENSCRTYDNAAYLDCYFDHVYKNVQYTCNHPILPTRGGSPLTGLNNCSTTTEVKNGIRQFAMAMKTVRTACSAPCTTFHYQGSLRESFMTDTRNITSLFVMYSDTSVTVFEEIFVFDTNAIISAVGGTLGLFIGFSVFDTLQWIIKKMWRACCTVNLD